MKTMIFSSTVSTEDGSLETKLSEEENNAVINGFRKVFHPIWELLEKNIDVPKYSSDISSICIVPECLAAWMLQFHEKERRYVSWATKEADMRLLIDFYEFKKGNEKRRRELIVDNIVESIKEIDMRAKKAKKHFDGERLIQDIRVILASL